METRSEVIVIQDSELITVDSRKPEVFIIGGGSSGGGGGEINIGANLGTGEEIFAGKTGVTLQFKSLLGGDSIILSSTSNDISISVENNGIDNSKLRDSSALSVIGRASNTSGDPDDIVASSDNTVLRRSGSTLGFGTLNLSHISMNTSRILGRTTSGVGSPEELTVGSGLSLSSGVINTGPDLSAIEDFNSTGIAVRTASNTWAQRSIITGGGITINNGDGTGGDISVAFGGTLVQNTTLDVDGNTLFIRDGADIRFLENESVTFLPSSTDLSAFVAFQTNSSYLSTASSRISATDITKSNTSLSRQSGNRAQERFLPNGEWELTNNSGASPTSGFRVNMTTSSFIFNDNNSSKAGILYGASGYVTNNRSLTDKEYVDTTIRGFSLSEPGASEDGQSFYWNDSGSTWEYYTPIGLTAVSANTVLAGGESGGAAIPTFRLLVADDIPDLSTLYLPISGGTLTGFLTLHANPVNSLHAATKGYVDGLVSGLSWKNPADLATTGDITLSGEQTIDGTMTSSSRVLVKDQADPTENGIYISNSSSWTRTTDADDGSELVAAALFVIGGSSNANTQWVCVSPSPITLSSDNIDFVLLGSSVTYTAGAGLNLTSTVFSVANDGITDSMLRESTALSVIGNSTNSSANPADIVASSDGHVLRRSGTSLGFGTIPIASSTMSTDRILGRTTASTGAVEELTVGLGLTLSSGSLSVNANEVISNSTLSDGAIYVGDSSNQPAARIMSGDVEISNTGVTTIVAPDLAALEGLSSTGIAVRTASNTWAQRTIVGSNTILVSNGNGVSGNPTLSVQQQAEIRSDTTYAVSTNDHGYVLYFTNAAGCSVTLPNALPTDFYVTLVRANGAGVISVNASTTLRTPNDETDIETEHGSATFQHIGSNVWYGWGSLGPVGSSGGGSGTVTSIDIIQPAAGITTTGGPITTSGDITLALANDLAALEGLNSTGIAVRTNTDTWAQRTIVGSNTISVSNGNGVSGNPTVSVTVPTDFTHTGTTYTIQESDYGLNIFLTNASGCTVTLPDGLSDDFYVTLVRSNGAGIVTINSETTLRTPNDENAIEIEHGSATFQHVGSNVWYGWGALGSGLGGSSNVYEWEDVTGTTYTMLSADDFKIKRFTNASGCTVTVPTGLPDDWSSIIYRADGAGVLTINSDGTLEGIGNTLETEETAVQILHRGSNVHVVLGALGGNPISGTSGQVAYFNSSSTITGEAGFEYNPTSNILSVSAIDLGVSGTTGTSRTLQAVGSGDDISINIIPKGDGNVTLGTTSATYLGVAGSSSGTARFVRAEGSSSNIDIRLVPKGTGTIIFGNTGTPSWDLLFTEDGAGNTLITPYSGSRGLTIRSRVGLSSGSPNGTDINLVAGDAFTVSGDGNGGDILIQSGQRRTAGSGTDGNITIDTLTGYLIIANIPTSSAGLPSGAVWSNSNVLTIVP